jgi:hypothetical protein
VIVAALLVVGAACGDSGGNEGPTATIAKPGKTTTTEAKTVEQQVEAAYLKSWKVYANAVRTLDASGLDAIYAERALDLVRDEVARLREANTPVVVQVQHDLHVQIVSDTDALVRDQYINRNYRIDAAGKPIDDQDDPGTYLETYQMKRVSGAWLVTRIVRESYQP